MYEAKVIAFLTIDNDTEEIFRTIELDLIITYISDGPAFDVVQDEILSLPCTEDIYDWKLAIPEIKYAK